MFSLSYCILEMHLPITRQQNFRLVQIKTNCRPHFKVHLNGKSVLYRGENILRNGKIACYKQFLLSSQSFPYLYIFSASKCDVVW